MSYTPLVLEGIENKVRKLIFSNQQLKEEKRQLSDEKQALQEQIEALKRKISQLEDDNNKIKVARLLSGHDTMQARQQVNELLREIDKCYSLLNR